MVKHFEDRGLTVVLLPSYTLLDTPVSCHPDMLCAKVNSRVLMHSGYFETYSSHFCTFPIDTTDEPMGKKYPSDILLNALTVGDTVYGRKEISSVIKSAHSRFVEVKQGYARCSTLLLGNAAVTADKTIAKALRSDGIDVLTVISGHIALDGYDCGFIGGASAVVGNEVLFYGDLTSHPDCDAITEFLKRHGFSAVSLGTEKLYDYGGAVLLTDEDRDRPRE